MIGSDASREDYLRIASHFQGTGNHFKAGHFFLKAKEYAKVIITIRVSGAAHEPPKEARRSV